MKIPKLGETESVPVPGLDGVTARVRYVRGRQSKAWTYRALAIDSKRTEDPAKDGFEATAQLFEDVFREAVVGVEGIEGLADDDAPGALELVERLPLSRQVELFNEVTRVQTLAPFRVSDSESIGDTPPE